jgi:hypothetical protein
MAPLLLVLFTVDCHSAKATSPAGLLTQICPDLVSMWCSKTALCMMWPHVLHVYMRDY